MVNTTAPHCLYIVYASPKCLVVTGKKWGALQSCLPESIFALLKLAGEECGWPRGIQPAFCHSLVALVGWSCLEWAFLQLAQCHHFLHVPGCRRKHEIPFYNDPLCSLNPAAWLGSWSAPSSRKGTQVHWRALNIAGWFFSKDEYRRNIVGL